MTTNNNIYDELARLERERDEARQALAAALGATEGDSHEVIHAAVAVMDHPQGPRILRHAIACERRVAAAEAERDAIAAQIAGLREKVESIKRGLCYWLPLDPWERVCVDLDALVATAPKSKDE